MSELIEQRFEAARNKIKELESEARSSEAAFDGMQSQIKELESTVFLLHNPHSGEECGCEICTNCRR